MSFQITVAGLALVAVFYACAAGLLTFLYRKASSKRSRWVFIGPLTLAVLVAPWGDELWIAWRFSEVCEDAGVQIGKRIAVDGFYNDTSSGTSASGVVASNQWIDALEKSGFLFHEARLLDGKVSRVEKIDGVWRQVVLDKPTARYHFKKAMSDADAGRAISCSEDVVIDSASNETVARYRYCKRYASFVESLWMRSFGLGPTQYCPTGDKELKNVLHTYVLTPSNKR
jgi:hypothetical protein